MDQCMSLVRQIHDKLEGATPNKEAQPDRGINSITEAAMELNNRAVRLRDVLESINGALA